MEKPVVTSVLTCLAPLCSFLTASTLHAGESVALSETKLVVHLGDVTNLISLLLEEEYWVQSNFPGYKSRDTFGPARKIFPSPLPGEDRTEIVQIEGLPQRVNFKYPPLAHDTSISALWNGYLTNSLLLRRSPQFARFQGHVLSMEVGIVVPYLIEQLDDDRPIGIVIVAEESRVRDLAIFSFLSHLQEAKTHEWVFPEFNGLNKPYFGERAEADAARERVKAWWSAVGRRSVEDQQLAWDTLWNHFEGWR